MSAYGSGVASAMGIHPDPVGTLDELRKENIDPAMVGSCSPPAPGVSSCKFYENCIFRFNKYGGFRDAGPAGVGYYHRTHEGRAHENDVPCFFFMKKMYHRMRDGERDRQDGKNGEIIEIVSIEEGRNHPLSGQAIHRQMTVNSNEAIPGAVPKWEKKTFTGPPGRFQRPSERQTISYDTLIEDRRRLREAEDPALAMPVHRVAGPVEPDPVIDLAPVLATPPTGPTPSAVPVERPKRGRPASE